MVNYHLIPPTSVVDRRITPLSDVVCNLWVTGSTPSGGSSFFNKLFRIIRGQLIVSLNNALRAQIAQLVPCQTKKSTEYFVRMLADGGRIMMDAGGCFG